eukprot:3860229-Prymnesium_polylepis.1
MMNSFDGGRRTNAETSADIETELTLPSTAASFAHRAVTSGSARPVQVQLLNTLVEQARAGSSAPGCR